MGAQGMACKFKTLFPETWLKKEVEGWGCMEERVFMKETESRKGFLYFQSGGDPTWMMG